MPAIDSKWDTPQRSKKVPATEPLKIECLLETSARIGADPLLVQASTGNTSIKLDGILWIKASGKCLAQAKQETILIPIDLKETRQRVACNSDPAGQLAVIDGKPLSTSVETAMHAVLPHRVVLHVHSVNTIAWAVRKNGQAELAARLDGIEWQWIPYVASGLQLARAIREAMERAPRTCVFILANHGLVVGAEDCDAADDLLRRTEERLAITPRGAPEPRSSTLERLAGGGWWRVPQDALVHAPGTDPISRRIVSGGVLYPCQAIFLTTQARVFPESVDEKIIMNLDEPFVMIEEAGVLARQESNLAESATLDGLVAVLQRIPECAQVQYLTEDQTRDLLCANSYHYRGIVEDNCRVVQQRKPVVGSFALDEPRSSMRGPSKAS
jgi:rhamnose utilization protein RhaD (predicted bifunctional aldolase and dehydrogenase)